VLTTLQKLQVDLLHVNVTIDFQAREPCNMAIEFGKTNRDELPPLSGFAHPVNGDWNPPLLVIGAVPRSCGTPPSRSAHHSLPSPNNFLISLRLRLAALEHQSAPVPPPDPGCPRRMRLLPPESRGSSSPPTLANGNARSSSARYGFREEGPPPSGPHQAVSLSRQQIPFLRTLPSAIT
jgi:hypothetical protein